VSEGLYSSVIKNSVHNKEEFNIERRSTQRVKYASFLANLALKNETNSSSCFEDEKHQEDQAAMNVGWLSLISLKS